MQLTLIKYGSKYSLSEGSCLTPRTSPYVPMQNVYAREMNLATSVLSRWFRIKFKEWPTPTWNKHRSTLSGCAARDPLLYRRVRVSPPGCPLRVECYGGSTERNPHRASGACCATLTSPSLLNQAKLRRGRAKFVRGFTERGFPRDLAEPSNKPDSESDTPNRGVRCLVWAPCGALPKPPSPPNFDP